MSSILSLAVLKEAIAKVKATVATKDSVAALTAIHIKGDAKTNTVTFTTYDLKNSTRYTATADKAHDFEALIPASLLLKFISKLTADAIQLDVDTKTWSLLMKYQGVKRPAELRGYKPSDFPSIQAFKADHTIKVNSAEFKQLIAATAFAADVDNPSDNEQNKALTGVGLVSSGRWLVSQVTDMGQGGVRKIAIQTGHNWLADVATFADIAATYQAPAANDAVYVTGDDKHYGFNGTNWVELVLPSYEIVVSAASIMPLASNLLNGLELTIGFNTKQLKLVCGPLEAITSRLEHQYPDLRGRFNEIRYYAPTIFAVDREEMKGALERAMVLVNSKVDNSNQLWVEIDSNKMTIRTGPVSDPAGTLEEEVSGLLLKGSRMIALVNGKHLVNAAKVTSTDRMLFFIHQAADPQTGAPVICSGYIGMGVMTSETGGIAEEPSASYLLLPLVPADAIAKQLAKTFDSTPSAVPNTVLPAATPVAPVAPTAPTKAAVVGASTSAETEGLDREPAGASADLSNEQTEAVASSVASALETDPALETEPETEEGPLVPVSSPF